jgi:hypothetical protein
LEATLHFLSNIGLGLLSFAIKTIPFIAAVCVGLAMSKHGFRTWKCWAAGIAILCVTAAMTWPAAEILKSAGCRGASDYQDCMDDVSSDD